MAYLFLYPAGQGPMRVTGDTHPPFRPRGAVTLHVPLIKVVSSALYYDAEHYCSFQVTVLHLGDDLTDDEIASLPEDYVYLAKERKLTRRVGRLATQAPNDFDRWYPWHILLEPMEDPEIGTELLSDTTEAVWGDASVRFYRYIDRWMEHIAIDDYTYWGRASDGTITSYTPVWPLSKHLDPLTAKVNNRCMVGLGGLRYGPTNNTSTPFVDALFPKWTGPARTSASGHRALTLGDSHVVERTQLDMFLFDGHGLLLGVRDDGTAYRTQRRIAPYNEPQWAGVEFKFGDQPTSRVLIYRSRQAWHFAFGMLCHTRYFSDVAPVLLWVPIVVYNEDVRHQRYNLRGLSPKVLADLHRSSGLTAAMTFALNALQGQLLKLERDTGLLRSQITKDWVQHCKPKHVLVTSIANNTLFSHIRDLPAPRMEMNCEARLKSRLGEDAWDHFSFLAPRRINLAVGEPVQLVATPRKLDL